VKQFASSRPAYRVCLSCGLLSQCLSFIDLSRDFLDSRDDASLLDYRREENLGMQKIVWIQSPATNVGSCAFS